ncbi:hypothetical protein DWX57_05485 [Coprococcus sp. AF19-8AC]|uniref:helicase-related protein n=1 Tax=Coprococcus sp. AF19-8AC TaxID=2293090 RepID=UPI000E7084D7|nr:helicase-related protein [Coprococcus sp. AF19-8AC]RJV46001.1 hypothetical protein DWX57_05485 [Coprococcus sp. AF19-8AC]
MGKEKTEIEYTDYQKRAIRRIVDSYMGECTSGRFLLADEVGLGKTIIARGVIRCLMCKLLEQEIAGKSGEQIKNEADYYYFNVIYICSNTNIAKQNEEKLGLGKNEDEGWTNRASCLSGKEFNSSKYEVEFQAVLQDYYKVYGNDHTYESLGRVNALKTRLRILPMTQRTSIDIKGRGKVEEREYLYRLIRAFSDDEIISAEASRGNEDFEKMMGLYMTKCKCDEEFNKACNIIRDSRNGDEYEIENFYNTWQIVRKGFAEITMDWLDCGLVIMDEFQNFKEIIGQASDDEESIIRKVLEQESDGEDRNPYVLMLSATPFRMYMSKNADQDETDTDTAGTENASIYDVCRFLEKGGGTNGMSVISSSLEAYKTALEKYSRSDRESKENVLEKKNTFERQMGSVFTRMERINVLRELREDCTDAEDTDKQEIGCGGIKALLDYTNELVEYDTGNGRYHIGTGTATAYAERIPYVLSFMNRGNKQAGGDDGYKIKRNFDEDVGAGKIRYKNNSKCYILEDDFKDMSKTLGEWHGVYEKVLEYILDIESLDIDSMLKSGKYNGMTREDVLLNHPGAARLLWVPSVVGWKELKGAFAEHKNFGKTVMFSDRVVVPRAMAWLISREVTRRLIWWILKQEQDKSITEKELQDFQESAKDILEQILEQILGLVAGFEENPERGNSGDEGIKTVEKIFTTSESGMFAVWSEMGLPIKRNKEGFALRDSGGTLQMDVDSLRQSIKDYCEEGKLQYVLQELEYIGNAAYLSDGHNVHEATEIYITLYEHTKDGRLQISRTGDNQKSAERPVETYYARCIGSGNDDDKVNSISKLQAAFNSPFAPFVFATTSIGQEGLDFHNYADRMVHLSIPANPTDFEQREGRINRYNCLAVRKAVMEWYGNKEETRMCSDDIPKLLDNAFEAAKASLCEESNQKLNCGIIPHWLVARKKDDNKLEVAGIKRLVPYFYNSSMMEKYHNMLKLLQLYRSVIGQADADELLERLMVNKKEADVQELYVDFSPYNERLQN